MKESKKVEVERKNNDFDEYQMSIRYKVMTRCFFILMLLVVVNGFINEYYIWAPTSIQALVLAYIPTIYFMTVTTFKGSYLSYREKSPIFAIIIFLIAGMMNLLPAILGYIDFGITYYFENGMLTNNFNAILLATFFIYSSICLYVKFKKDNKEEIISKDK